MKAKSIVTLLFGKVTILLALYFGHVYSPDINKFILNTFEKKTHVAQGYYPNIAELQVFLDKKKGYFVPSYGTEDNKIEIAEDMAPVDLYGLLKERIENNHKGHSEQIADILYRTIDMYADSLTSEQKEQLANKLIECYSHLDPMHDYQSGDKQLSFRQRTLVSLLEANDIQLPQEEEVKLTKLVSAIYEYNGSEGVAKEALGRYILDIAQ